MSVNESGDVVSAESISGDDDLRIAALQAARKWRFQPYIREGKPVPVSTVIPFDFAFPENVKELDPALAALANPSLTASGVDRGGLVYKVNPAYPPSAKKAGIQGIVVLRAVIAKDGTIKSLRVVTGNPELIQAALDAVQQWRYKPFYLKGTPVEMHTQVSVAFTLGRN